MVANSLLASRASAMLRFLGLVVALLSTIASRQLIAQQTSPSDQRPVVDPSELDFHKLGEINTRFKPKNGSLPPDYSDVLDQQAKQAAAPVVSPYTFWWEAPEIWYHPLYFDDVPVERYGQSPAPRLQPIYSGLHFVLTLPILPYKAAIDPPRARMTNLGYYRPGSPAPCVGRRLPWQRNAALVQTATVLGLVFVLP